MKPQIARRKGLAAGAALLGCFLAVQAFWGIPAAVTATVLLAAAGCGIAWRLFAKKHGDAAALILCLLKNPTLEGSQPLPGFMPGFADRLSGLMAPEREQRRQQADYTSFQMQINPHFLYNTLECIRSEALLGGKENIAGMVEHLARFFRYSIFGKTDILTINDELENIRDYFFIQQYRFGNRCELQIELEDDTVLNAEIPKMTFQPIVENAIFHGLEGNVKNGIVRIRITHTEAYVLIVISDNGVGMDHAALSDLQQRLLDEGADHPGDHGIALPNVNKRIKMHFGKDYGLEVHSVVGVGTDVVLHIPYIYQD